MTQQGPPLMQLTRCKYAMTHCSLTFCHNTQDVGNLNHRLFGDTLKTHIDVFFKYDSEALYSIL